MWCCQSTPNSSLGCLEGVPIRRFVLVSYVLTCPGLFGWGRLQKERWDGCLFPITLPVTSVLGGKMAGALNALALVRVSGGGQCPCARRFPTRSSLFPYSTAASTRPLIDSLDAISVFEAADVDGCVYVRPEHRVEGLALCTDSFVTCIGGGTPY